MTPEQLKTLAIAKARQRAAQGSGDFAAKAASMASDDLMIARTKNDAFGQYLRDQAMKPREGESPEQRERRLYGSLPTPERPGTAEGMTRSFLQGGTFGAGDEIVAGGAAALDSLVRGEDYGKAYDARVANERRKLDQFREDSPVAAYGTEIAGAIPTALIPAGAVAKASQGAPLLGKMLLGAGAGAGEGAVYGFNAGEGGLENRLSEAAKTGALSAVLGAGTPLAGAGAQKAMGRILTKKASGQVGTSRPGYEVLSRVLQSDDSLTGPGAQRLATAGPDAMLADAGPSAKSLLDTAVQRSGPGAKIGREAVEKRASTAGKSLQSTLDDLLGAPEGVKTAAKGIAKETRQARDDAYTAAYEKAIDYASDAGRKIESVLGRVPNRVMKGAVETANERMQAAGIKNKQILIDIADDGAVTFKEMPNVQQLDEIKKALGIMGAEAVDQFGRRTGAGQMYSRLARDIKSATSEAVPEYGQAVKIGGDKIERDTALALGRDLLKPGTTRETVTEFVDDMSDEARQAAAQGLRSTIDDTLANVKRALTDGNMDAREAVKLIKDLSSRANREKVSMILGDDVGKRLFSELDKASAAFDLRAGVARNSATFARQAMDDVVKRQSEPGPIGTLIEGSPIEAGRKALRTVTGRTDDARLAKQDQIYAEIARILTEPGAAQRLQSLQTVAPRVQAGTDRARLLAEQLMMANPAVSAPATR